MDFNRRKRDINTVPFIQPIERAPGIFTALGQETVPGAQTQVVPGQLIWTLAKPVKLYKISFRAEVQRAAGGGFQMLSSTVDVDAPGIGSALGDLSTPGAGWTVNLNRMLYLTMPAEFPEFDFGPNGVILQPGFFGIEPFVECGATPFALNDLVNYQLILQFE